MQNVNSAGSLSSVQKTGAFPFAPTRNFKDSTESADFALEDAFGQGEAQVPAEDKEDYERLDIGHALTTVYMAIFAASHATKGDPEEESESVSNKVNTELANGISGNIADLDKDALDEAASEIKSLLNDLLGVLPQGVQDSIQALSKLSDSEDFAKTLIGLIGKCAKPDELEEMLDMVNESLEDPNVSEVFKVFAGELKEALEEELKKRNEDFLKSLEEQRAWAAVNELVKQQRESLQA